MPQVIVMADGRTDRGETPVMLRERVNAADFESSHFAEQLVERIGWAVGDAHEVERELAHGEREQPHREREQPRRELEQPHRERELPRREHTRRRPAGSRA